MAQVLVVEDDDEFLSVVELFLRGDGFEVVTVRNVEEASLILRNSDGFDIIVSDFYLQKSTAAPLLDLISESHPSTPVILTSGGNELVPIEAIHAIGAVSGAISFLQKPFRRSQLLKSVYDALGEQN